jgi:hypothetical protein
MFAMSKLVIFILFFIFTSNAIAYHFSISDIPVSRPSNGGIDNPDQTGGSAGGNFESLGGLPNIKRNIEPNYKDFTIKNKSIHIEVVIPNYGRSFDDILIKEKVDDGFGNISDLHICIANPIYSTNRTVYSLKNNTTTDIRTLFDNMKENYSIVNRNALYIKIPKLNLGEDIVYDYVVKSNASGIFCVDTLFRLNGSKWPDSIRQDTIEVRPPEIEVDTIEDQFYAISNEPIDITYNILHRSGWCTELTEISAFFNRSDKYEIRFKEKNDETYKEYNGKTFKLNLTPLEVTSYPIQIVYHNAGKHPIPRLNVLGATVNQKNIEIDVAPDELTKNLQDYGPFISSFIAVIGILFSFYQLRNQQEEIKKMEVHIDGLYQYINVNNETGQDRINRNNATQINKEDSTNETDCDLDL